MNYIPENWKIIRITDHKTGEFYYRIAAGFVGGYVSGRSWKISSRIVGIEKSTSDYVSIKSESGSIYLLHFVNEGLDQYTEGIVESYREELEKFGDGVVLVLIDWKDYAG